MEFTNPRSRPLHHSPKNYEGTYIMTISGRTLVYVLIGDPIGHARTPELYNAKFAERGIDAVVIPMHLPPDGLGDLPALARSWKNLAGIGVTIPHKEGMTSLVDELSDSARLCGATNVIRRAPDGRLVGTQMDGPGFVSSLKAAGFDPQGRRALLVGAGGTAKAIAFELAASGIQELTLTNRSVEKAEILAQRVREAYPACEVEATALPDGDYELIINATSVGMKETDPLPLDMSLIKPSAVVADVIMSPPETALLREARERGCVVHPGHLMLEAQFEATVQFLGLENGARS